MDTDPAIPKVEASPGGSGDGSSDVRRSSDPDLKKARKEKVCTAKERISRMPPCAAGKRSSIYRGVTRHRWTGRYEAHLWDKSTWNQNQNKKGKQVYLGAYDDEEAAARTYDLASLKYWGAGTLINFPVTDYARDLEEMQIISKEDYLVSLRRKSSAFSRGLPKYRGLTRQPTNSHQWEASLGPMQGNDYFSNRSTSSGTTMDARYSGIAGTEQKIDLTSYIRWWMPKKVRQAESAFTEDVAQELKMLECSAQPTEPHKLPSLGYPRRGKSMPPSLSACSILSQSNSFKTFLEKSLNSADRKDDPSQLKMDQKTVPLFSNCGLVISGVSLAFDDLPVPRTAYQMSLLSAPQRTNYSVDTFRKKETDSSAYTYKCQE